MGIMTLPSECCASLEALAEELELPHFDLLLVGDGSGSVYDQPAGWACAAYDRRKCQVTAHVGAVSGGTIGFAELAPYLQALTHHHSDHGRSLTVPVEVVIVSDSEVTVRCGNRQYSRNANLHLWAGIDWFERNGYQLTWLHVYRASNHWNVMADSLAGCMRTLIAAQRDMVVGPGHH